MVRLIRSQGMVGATLSAAATGSVNRRCQRGRSRQLSAKVPTKGAAEFLSEWTTGLRFDVLIPGSRGNEPEPDGRSCCEQAGRHSNETGLCDCGWTDEWPSGGRDGDSEEHGGEPPCGQRRVQQGPCPQRGRKSHIRACAVEL